VLDRTAFDVRQALDRAVARVSDAAAGKGLTIDVRAADEVPARMTGDEGRVVQIVANLLDNAVKFTDSGAVVLRASVRPADAGDGSPAGGTLRLEVQDTGIGIEPDRLSRLFEPFEQGDASMTRRFGGTGLGLAIAKRLAGLMRGRLWAVSAPGQGSTFSVELPIEP
jgi:signal transduction histidine kinase